MDLSSPPPNGPAPEKEKDFAIAMEESSGNISDHRSELTDGLRPSSFTNTLEDTTEGNPISLEQSIYDIFPSFNPTDLRLTIENGIGFTMSTTKPPSENLQASIPENLESLDEEHSIGQTIGLELETLQMLTPATTNMGDESDDKTGVSLQLSPDTRSQIDTSPKRLDIDFKVNKESVSDSESAPVSGITENSEDDVMNAFEPVLRLGSIPRESRVSPYPHGIRKSNTHPYSDYYTDEFRELPADTAKLLVAKVTLEDIQAFRNASLDWSLIEVERKTQTNGVIFANLKTSALTPNRPFALYSVYSITGFATILIPIHPELVARDRPDLYAIQLTPHSTDVLNEGHSASSNFFPGDTIVVLSMRRRSGVNPESLKKDMCSVRDIDSHKFWAVTEYFVLPRYIQQEVPVIVHSRNPRIRCVATNVTSFVQVKKPVADQHKSLFRDVGNVMNADVFVPTIFPGQFIRGLRRGDDAHLVVNDTDIQQGGERPVPSIMKVVPMGREQKEEFEAAPNVFAEFPNDPKRALRALIATNLLGMSACVAAANKNKDYRTYATQVEEIVPTGKAELLRINLQHSSGVPSLSKWMRSTLFFLKYLGVVYQMEVENSELNFNEETRAQQFVILAKLATAQQCHREALNQIQGERILVYQRAEHHKQLFRLFPKLEDFDRISMDEPGMRLLQAILGGPTIPSSRIPTGDFNIDGCDIKLSEPQMEYVWKFLFTPIPAIVANCPFGTGKSLMALAAALVSAQKNQDSESLNIVCASSNLDTTSLYESYQNLVPGNIVHVVRLVNSKNREGMDEQYQTPVDFSKLWSEVFRKHIMAVDQNTMTQDYVSELMHSAILHMIREKYISEYDLESHRLQNIAVDANFLEPKFTKEEVFMKLYKPKIILGTVSSICKFFQNGTFSQWRRHVSTLQIDEASQLPIHDLLTLVSIFHKAKTALLGDHHQLPPYSDSEMLEKCKKYTIGAVLQAACTSGAVPSVNLRDVYTCPPEITNLCSDAFYGKNVLRSTRQPLDHNRFNEALGIRSVFPLQVINLNHAIQNEACMSLSNVSEAELAINIAKRIHDSTEPISIGILCFYKAQAGLVSTQLGLLPCYVGTIDGSQGQTFDVTIILTTRTNSLIGKFLESENRLNVAVSRTKEACYLICNPNAVSNSYFWSSFCRRIGNHNTVRGNDLKLQGDSPEDFHIC